jgi:hypothetical protein
VGDSTRYRKDRVKKVNILTLIYARPEVKFLNIDENVAKNPPEVKFLNIDENVAKKPHHSEKTSFSPMFLNNVLNNTF